MSLGLDAGGHCKIQLQRVLVSVSVCLSINASCIGRSAVAELATLSVPTYAGTHSASMASSKQNSSILPSTDMVIWCI